MEYNPFSLRDKKILITGASSGLGAQFAIDCSKMGAQVILVGRNEERLKHTISCMTGKEHIIISYDLHNLSGIKDLMRLFVEKKGKLDGFVHAAGIEKTLPIKLLKPEDYEELYKVNVLSGIEIAKYFGSKKYSNKGSKIVFISSISGVIGRTGVAAYAATKGALISITRTMALEYASKKINVNCISPGTILTPMMINYFQSLSEEDISKRKEGFPLGLGKPEDVSGICLFLLSDAAKWITGQNIIVDGGYTVK